MSVSENAGSWNLQTGPSFGAHAFIWAADWTRDEAERVIGGAAAANLDFVEIPLLDLDAMDVGHTKALLDEYEIGCACSLGLPKSLHLPFDPGGAEQFLARALELTADLGAPALTGSLYTHLGTLTGAPPENNEIRDVARILKSIARRAANLGLEIGIEPVNRYETYLINLTSQAKDILDAIDEPNVFVHLDTYHVNIEEKGFYDPIVNLGPQLRYIHLSESDRGTPGTGNVHWDKVFEGLSAIDYTGALVMESFVAVNEAIIGATALWRDVVGDPNTLVTDGLAFLRGKATEYRLGV